MITRKSYEKRLNNADNRLVKRLVAYLKVPDEKNVHDIRTATRRLIAATELLPRKVREKKKIRKHIDRYEELMKRNAKIRDLDVMLLKIEQDPTRSVHEPLKDELRRQRDDNVEKAKKYASPLRYHPHLHIQLKQVSDSELEKRFQKIVAKSESRIRERTTTVLKDSEDKDAVHRLREDVRRLRYTLDLGTGDKLAKHAASLKEWQDLLGDIHDSDIFIQRLENMKATPETNSLLDDEILLRNRNYQKFKTLAS